MTKEFKIKEKSLDNYCKVVNSSKDNYPLAFILTIWNIFQSQDYENNEYYLVELDIEVIKKPKIEERYYASLKRVELLKKRSCELWTYQLLVYEEEKRIVTCIVKIIVR